MSTLPEDDGQNGIVENYLRDSRDKWKRLATEQAIVIVLLSVALIAKCLL